MGTVTIAALASRIEKPFKDVTWIDQYLTGNKPYNSDFLIKKLIFDRAVDPVALASYKPTRRHPKRNHALQFWDQPEIPQDVMATISENRRVFGSKFHSLFDTDMARKFISEVYGSRLTEAYDQCYHPAMKSDYFRLCYLYACGGIYIDADIRINEELLKIDLNENRIFLTVLIRDRELIQGSYRWHSISDYKKIVSADDVSGARNLHAYFQNDLILVNPLNEIIKVALIRATVLIEHCKELGKLPNIHAVTGPTNISAAVFIHLFHAMIMNKEISDVRIIERSSSVVQPPMEYKKDDRYWLLAAKKYPGFIPRIG